jgi:hypothetical protein
MPSEPIGTYISTNVLESENGRASSMALRISPWQYSGESHGAVTEPLMYNAEALGIRLANAAAARFRNAIV